MKVLPYLLSTIAGVLLFILGSRLSENFKDLVVNIAAAFLAIPVLFLIYELSQKYSHKRLNKEIFDYAKVQVDTEVLTIVNHLIKIVYPYEKRDLSFEGVNKFISLKLNEIDKILSDTEYLGFQIFKNWSISKRNIQNILENPYVLKRLDDDQIISIISMLKSLRHLESIQSSKLELFELTEKKIEGHRVARGTELNKNNIEYPDRLLLLKNIGNEKFLVIDFGDFEPYDVDNLLNLYRLDQKFLHIYGVAIFDFLQEIKNWLNLTGKEFLIDTKMFRMTPQSQK